MTTSRTLVAGIGNVLLGDDGFGVEVARRLAGRRLPDVDVVDFGIRGLDLVYALLDRESVVLIDAMPRGRDPGTLYVIEPEIIEGAGASVAVHGVDPAKALAMARAMGASLPFVRIVGCEPAHVPEDDFVEALSEPVAAAVDGAVALVEALLREAGHA